MSLFARRAAPAVEERGVFWPGYPGPPALAPNSSGVTVTLENYTRSAAVWACVRIIVSAVKKLPVDVVRYRGTTRVPVLPAPQIITNPSSQVNRRAWTAQVVRSMLTAGNAYADVVETDANMGRPITLDTIAPARVAWLPVDKRWVPHVDGKPREVWPSGDLWHLPATDFLPAGQPYALAPVEQARTSIGTSIAAEDFGARFFGDGAHPTSVIYSDQDIGATQAKAIKESFLNAIRGTREPAVFGSALKYQQVQVSPSDSQFIDLLRFEVEQACRWFGVPPAMVFVAISGQHITYTNASQADLAFLKHSVDNWLVDLEDALTSMIPAPQQVKFNTSAMLRMDEVGRWQIHDLRLKNKTTTINAVKAIEDEQPFPEAEYDQPGIPGLAPSVTDVPPAPTDNSHQVNE